MQESLHSSDIARRGFRREIIRNTGGVFEGISRTISKSICKEITRRTIAEGFIKTFLEKSFDKLQEEFLAELQVASLEESLMVFIQQFQYELQEKPIRHFWRQSKRNL